MARLAGTVIAFGACLLARVRPGWSVRARGPLVMAAVSGAVDAAANVCYVLATRAGLFGIAVVITALYPGMTVLLARLVLGERMRSWQRVGPDPGWGRPRAGDRLSALCSLLGADSCGRKYQEGHPAA